MKATKDRVSVITVLCGTEPESMGSLRCLKMGSMRTGVSKGKQGRRPPSKSNAFFLIMTMSDSLPLMALKHAEGISTPPRLTIRVNLVAKRRHLANIFQHFSANLPDFGNGMDNAF